MRKVFRLFLTTALFVALLCSCGKNNEVVGEMSKHENTEAPLASTQGNDDSAVSEAAASPAVAHTVPAGQSADVNPLKGLIPFAGQTSFPHSMEWFYIPVSDVQIAENLYDWTAFETRLNEIAARGHQAVLRFYYDYPGTDSGVPSYLITKYDLQMKPYDEPDALGGEGLCPDYANAKFRRSMREFITILGANYDGDPRIGFITEGLLGFWGEWHNWPFDEDTSDGYPDWSIPAEVYSEVYEAYDNAFDKTQLIVREPKAGVDNASFRTGYHDDSFCYSTLSEDNGGQSWSFLSRLKAQGVYDNWKFGAVGGEVYPPLQAEIFKDSPEAVDWAPLQDWTACVNESHASWLMCDKIKTYSDSTRDNAISASKQLGYELRVTNGYFPDVYEAGMALNVGIDITNIGVAPFYYDHTTWPVMIGIKQDGTLVKKWKTDWDLNSIETGGSVYSFMKTINDPGLGKGTYTVCIKVANPLSGGVLLSFANDGQEADGWLTLGSMVVEGEEKSYDPVKDDLGPKECPVMSNEGSAPGAYEAESGVLEGTACLSDSFEASGGKMVGWIGTGDGESGSLTFDNVEVEEDGVYTLYVGYALGEAHRNATLLINGEEEVEIDFTATGGWTTPGKTSVEVFLRQGTNTLRFYNDNGYAPDIDFIRIEGDTAAEGAEAEGE